MLTYIIRRLAIAIPVLLGILLISFVFVRMLPGDPSRVLMSPAEIGASPDYIARRRAELGIDDSVAVQFIAWIRELADGNLGYSFHAHLPVTQMISERIWPTVLLTCTGVGLALLIGLPVGVFAALRQNSLFDHLVAVGSMLAISIPIFFVGLISIYIFALWLGILPSGGMRTFTASETTLLDSLRHLALPAGVLSAVLVGPYVRFTRQSMLEVLHQDYITTARAKGVPRPMIVVMHGLRNALIPLTTVLAIQIPALLAGTVIIETIFSWPGIGRLVLEGIINRDYPVITAIVLMSAMLVMLFNLIADLLTAVLDPRIRL